MVHTKHQDELITQIYWIWISYFGCPKKFLSDNDGEFANKSFIDMRAKLNIEVATTAGESSFSNGTVETHDKVLAEAMQKTLDDVKCELNMPLAWAVRATNALQNCGGYSPNQLVRNVNMPTVLEDKLSASESDTSSDIIRENLEALHSARKNFIQAESSERIRRALRHNVHTYADKSFNNGDTVYYKWRNLGQDGQFVLVRHGSSCFRLHPCQLIKTCKQEISVINENETSERIPEANRDGELRVPNLKYKQANSNMEIQEDDVYAADVDVENVVEDAEDDDEFDQLVENAEVCEGIDLECDEGADNVIENVEDCVENDLEAGEDGFTVGDNGRVTSNQRTAENIEGSINAQTAHAQQENIVSNCFKTYETPKPNICIKFRLIRQNERTKARVLSKQPKRTGKNKHWFNILQEGDEKPSSVDWKQVSYWEKVVCPESVLLVTDQDQMSQDIVDAKEKELKNMTEDDVFERVPFYGQTTVSCKWMFTEKSVNEKKVVKARLVARGFEEDSSNLRTDSTTCCKQSICLVFLTAASNKWEIKFLDIKAAFLQRDKIERDVFLRLPGDVCPENEVWKLKRCIYGLNDAPRAWYSRVNKEMLKQGATVSKYDSSLFLWHKDGKLVGILVAYVDDFAYCGTYQWERIVVDSLKKTFKISTSARGAFRYVGLNVL